MLFLVFDADRCYARCQVSFRLNLTASAGPVSVLKNKKNGYLLWFPDFDADRCCARCQVFISRNPTVSAGPVGVLKERKKMEIRCGFLFLTRAGPPANERCQVFISRNLTASAGPDSVEKEEK